MNVTTEKRVDWHDLHESAMGNNLPGRCEILGDFETAQKYSELIVAGNAVYAAWEGNRDDSAEQDGVQGLAGEISDPDLGIYPAAIEKKWVARFGGWDNWPETKMILT